MSEKHQANVISTNHLLEVMRKHISKEDAPILHYSPYECGTAVKIKETYKD